MAGLDAVQAAIKLRPAEWAQQNPQLSWPS